MAIARDRTTASKSRLTKADGAAYLEMWKACVELHKFHDGLKQERAKRFTIVQIALVGGFGISIQSVAGEAEPIELWVATGAAVAALVAGLLYSWIMIALDERAAQYVTTIKNQVQHVEKALAGYLPALRYLPYQGQYQVIHVGSTTLRDDGDYVAPKVPRRQTPSAHSREQFILKAVHAGWWAALLGLAAVLTLQLRPHTSVQQRPEKVSVPASQASPVRVRP